jgi:DnaJ-class molecular chaperone
MRGCGELEVCEMGQLRPDYYELLAVPRDADERTIKSAFRRLARQYHPDMNPGDAGAHARFIEVSEAFEVLSDPHKRALYDDFGPLGLEEGFDAEGARRARRQRAAEEQARTRAAETFNTRSERGFESVFGDTFRAYNPFRSDFFKDPRPEPARGADVREELTIELLVAVRGGPLSMMRGGAALVIKLPPNVESGYTVQIAGEGERSADPAGATGDLWLTVKVEEHPYLSREGLDLMLVMPITITEALLGAKVSVPTPHGECLVTIPEGVHSGARLRLKEMGARVGEERGDFYVIVEIRSPARLDAAVREAAAVIGRAYQGDVRAGWRL